MSKAICMVEYAAISRGVAAADGMVKAAAVSLHKIRAVCPGRLIAVFSGRLGAVKAAVDFARANFPGEMEDCFVIGRPHAGLLAALIADKAMPFGGHAALGMLETTTVASCALAADYSLKAADVRLLHIHYGSGMCGKCYFLISGSVADVEEALAAAKANLSHGGAVVDWTLIPNPDETVWKALTGGE